MKRGIIISVLALATLVTSCSWFEDFDDTNVNPGVTNKPIPSALLTKSELWIGNLAGYGRDYYVTHGTIQALYCQYFAETQYPEASLYALPKISSSAYYSRILMDLQNIINLNTDDATKVEANKYGENVNQIAIAKILQSYVFWFITDTWGDVPYATALKGDLNVEFETQESIYKGIIQTLTDAASSLQTSGSPILGDVIYNGDVTKWKKLANSIRVLMALRLSKRYPGATEYAATELKAALNSGVIESNSDNFMIPYPGGSFKCNYWLMYDGRKDYGESATMVSLLNGISDPRQSVFGSSNVGVPYGRTRDYITNWTTSNPNWAYVLNPAYRAENSPVFIVTAAHVWLARAEAAQLGWTAEVVNTCYENGITASFNQWGLGNPSPGYLAGVALPGDNTGNLQNIWRQQYIAFYPNGHHGWANWRRTGYPLLTPAPDATNGGVIPRRFMYGDTEYSLNKSAVETAVARISGGDTEKSRVWWDVQ